MVTAIHSQTIVYKPISLLPQFKKNTRKLFEIRLDSFNKIYKLLNNHQFQANRSTEIALIKLVEKLTSAIYNISLWVLHQVNWVPSTVWFLTKYYLLCSTEQ